MGSVIAASDWYKAMINFADEAIIEVRSGKGGNGCISFRREKYIPRGGPNGGDGGKGGDVLFCVKRNMRTLAKLRNKVVFKAKNGGDGSSWNKFGKNGDDVVIAVPPGTTIRDAETGELIKEFTDESEDEQFLFLKGGKGGWGNVHFKSSTNQAPRYAHSGTPGEVRTLKVELSIMADVGLVGFPNAGKSSLLTAFTNARPKVAPYPFTTKIPHLGVLHVDDERDIIIADIPGIIEGASEGVGLGIQFLKHISRTSCLIYMIDCADENYRTAYSTLKSELATFSEELASKPRMVLCNKIDVAGAKERAREIIDAIHADEPETAVIAVSVTANMNMRDAKLHIVKMVDERDGGQSLEEETVSSFLASRSLDEAMEVQYPGSEQAEAE